MQMSLLLRGRTKGNLAHCFHLLLNVFGWGFLQEILKLLMKTFVMSRLSYCSLVWMFHDRNLNNKMARIRERALRIALFKEDVSRFEKLSEMDNAVTVHQRNLQLLMVVIYKTKYDLNPSFMKQILRKRNALHSG